MQDYMIFVDTSADIEPAYAAANDIRFVPMHYTLGAEDRLCDEMQDEEILTRFYNGQKNGDLTQTSQISPGVYLDLFTPLMQEGKDIIYISLSSGLTKTFDNVMLAQAELKESFPERTLYPVDSLSASAGLGLLAEAAVEGREKGLSAKENADRLTELAGKLCVTLMVDDLMYLKRGGRLPATTAIIGTMLNVKPILCLNPEGKLSTLTKKRGEKPALKELVSLYAEYRDASLGNHVYVIHGSASERADHMIDLVREVDGTTKITKMMEGPIIGAHTGPGTILLIYFGDRTKLK